MLNKRKETMKPIKIEYLSAFKNCLVLFRYLTRREKTSDVYKWIRTILINSLYYYQLITLELLQTKYCCNYITQN